MKEKTPNEIMDEAINHGLTDFYVAYSGGKDSGIALDFMAKEPIAIIKPIANRLVILDKNLHKVQPNMSKNNERLTIQTFINTNGENIDETI